MERIPYDARRGGIQTEWAHGELTIKEIALKYKVSVGMVNKWKNRETTKTVRRKRKMKFNQKIKRYLFKTAGNKFTGIEKASSRKLANKISKKFNLPVSHSSVNRWLKKTLSKPRKATTTFILTKDNKAQRALFADNIIELNIKGSDIFFTDEKYFHLHTPLNPQSNQIRFTKKNLKKLKRGDPAIVEKLRKPMPKYSEKFMLAAGVSSKGVGKLIFCVGTMNSSCYDKALQHYRDDVQRLDPNLYFQQDNAPCHTSGQSMNFIRDPNNFINHIPKWPTNSPDLVSVFINL